MSFEARLSVAMLVWFDFAQDKLLTTSRSSMLGARGWKRDVEPGLG
jgi:hypothetical protein